MTSIIWLMLVIVIMPKLATGMPMPIRTHIYLQTKAQYELFHGQYDVVMFGDSLTERGHWSDMFPGVRIGNRGIGGDDTQGMLERIQSIESTGAKTVFIMAGTNDLSRSVQPNTIARNIITIAKILSAQGIHPIIQSTVLSGRIKLGKNPKTVQINELLKLNAQANGFTYIDINRFLAPNGYLPDNFTIDGTHLTAEGYNAWYRALKRHIEPSNSGM